MDKFFLHQIKHTNGSYEKGIAVKDSLDDALQSYHAYFGAYAYGHDTNTDFVHCMITDAYGSVVGKNNEYWNAKLKEPE